jgi:serine protease Do
MAHTGKASVYLLLILLGLIAGIFIGGEVIRNIYLNPDAFSFLAGRKAADQTPAQGQSRISPASRMPDAAATDDAVSFSRRNAIVTATEQAAPCVVGIVVTQLQVESYYAGDDFFDLFLAPKLVPKYKEIENMGSGFIISDDGLILTNNHVVQNAQKLFVNFPDGRQLPATIVGQDPYSDLAVVSVHQKGFRAARFGNSDELMSGEWVIAIGNPFLNFFNDPNPTVTVGVVSAKNRNFTPMEDVYYQNMIQTDAAINPGNSGGPLVNARGEVIGINTFIFTGSKKYMGSIGIGFAIPINRAKRVVDELEKFGKRRQIWTGIIVQDIDRPVALTLGYEHLEGVLVTDVQAGSSGEAAGLKAGDVITQMGDRLIRSHADLDGFFLNYFVGDSIDISVLRKRQKVQIRLTLKEFPSRLLQ